MVQAIQKFTRNFTDAQLADRTFLVTQLKDLKANITPRMPPADCSCSI